MVNITESTITIDEAKALSHDQLAELLVQTISDKNELLAAIRDFRFGRKSEKLKVIAEQCSLFNEVETLTDPQDEEEEVVEEVVRTRKKTGRKKPSEANPDLEVVEVVVDIDEKEKEGCKQIGVKAVEVLRFRPAKMWIERRLYYVYEKELEDDKSEIKSKHTGQPFLSGSSASPEIVASIINDKFAKGLPLYRIESVFNDLNGNISRQTMSNWLQNTCLSYLDILYDRMKTRLLKMEVLHADETTVKVLNHQDGSTNTQSYMWVYRSAKCYEDNIVIYEYQPGRSGDYPKAFLKGFKGYLHTDGYSGYNGLKGVIRIGCLAHARRYFVDAFKAVDKKSPEAVRAKVPFDTLTKIFALERKLDKVDADERERRRQKELAPLFDEFKAQLEEAKETILLSSKLKDAVNYSLNQFECFKNILLDERLVATNNIIERDIKPFVIGRKAWLFCNTTGGAQTSSKIYSIVQSARANNLRVEKYFNYLLTTMSEVSEDQWNEAFLDSLLPHSKTLPNDIYKPSRT